jgi:hypothetical protein
MRTPSGFDHVSTTKSNSTRGIATHPFDKLRAGSCKKRKDGAPSVGMVHAKIVKGGPPAIERKKAKTSRYMPKTLMLVLALMLLTGWLTAQEYPQTGSSQARTATGPTTNGKEAWQMKDHESSHAAAQSQTDQPTRKHAKAKITVQSSEVKPYDQTASPALMEIRLSETFTGDIDGESPVRALQVMRDDHSASLVSVQRFRGKLGGRQGTFVLQGSEIVENGKIKATWFVVPGSGTGDLSGLRGEGGFEGDFGKGSDGTLDYWFE